MKNILFAVFFTIIIVLSVGCDSTEKGFEPIIYEHEKLYEQYKQTNPNDWEPIPQTTMGENVTMTANGPSITFFKEEVSLLEYGRYSVKVAYPVDRMESGNKVQSAPEIFVYRNEKLAKKLPIQDGFYAYNSNGEEVAKLVTGSHTPGYYDPYEKDKEPYCWYKVDEGAIRFKFLAVEPYFISNDFLPWAMVEEDYMEITEKIIARDSNDEKILWDFNVGDWIATEKNLEILGLHNAVDRTVFEDGIHVVKLGEDALYKELNDIFEDMGYTIEEKRFIESKVVKENYAAYMVMITLTIDISGDIPTTELSYEMISPENSDIAEIYLSGKEVDYNKLLEDMFAN